VQPFLKPGAAKALADRKPSGPPGAEFVEPSAAAAKNAKKRAAAKAKKAAEAAAEAAAGVGAVTLG
jgi:hypothetical protein